MNRSCLRTSQNGKRYTTEFKTETAKQVVNLFLRLVHMSVLKCRGLEESKCFLSELLLQTNLPV